ncbi:uncharacterized protein LOC127151181 [Cucumis melo]|uniref:Uncharacterized protein LOC127151181 n=1 Tax=Cucumis melo TaxID=3656 RepID=A0ABM3L960_CUCME|nr:uncharacterized protein LOC127151181 [Cucumis melo]
MSGSPLLPSLRSSPLRQSAARLLLPPFLPSFIFSSFISIFLSIFIYVWRDEHLNHPNSHNNGFAPQRKKKGYSDPIPSSFSFHFLLGPTISAIIGLFSGVNLIFQPVPPSSAVFWSITLVPFNFFHLGGWKWEPLFSHSTKLEPIEEVTIKCDLLDMPAVGQLEKDAKYSLVYQLLKIFLTQRLDAYMEFQAANSSLLKSYGLVHEDCIAKMRLLSLVDLGSNESARIPYALIKGVTCVLLVLQINDDEVELWVVKAITSKLIDCKMDQMNEVVIVRESWTSPPQRSQTT